MMADNDSLAAAIIVVLMCDEDFAEKEEKKKQKRSKCVRPLFAKRDTDGFFAEFDTQLRAQDPALFKNFVRMSADDFDYLVELLRPRIEKQDTSFRKAITVSQRLAVTLRYLATGESFSSMQYLFRMSKTSIWRIVEETCTELYEALKGEHMKVSSY